MPQGQALSVQGHILRWVSLFLELGPDSYPEQALVSLGVGWLQALPNATVKLAVSAEASGTGGLRFHVLLKALGNCLFSFQCFKQWLKEQSTCPACLARDLLSQE